MRMVKQWRRCDLGTAKGPAGAMPIGPRDFVKRVLIALQPAPTGAAPFQNALGEFRA